MDREKIDRCRWWALRNRNPIWSSSRYEEFDADEAERFGIDMTIRA